MTRPSQAHDPSGSHPSRLEQRLHAGPHDRAGRDRPVRDAGRLVGPALARPRPRPISPSSISACVNPVTGPVFIDGAKPGDALKVTVLSSSRRAGAGPATSRASACSPTSSPTRRLHHWHYDPGLAPAMYGPGGRVPLRPFTGTIGVAPAAPGPAQHHPAAQCRRQHGRARHRRRHRALAAGRGRRARCSRSATRMPRKATARSAARRSKARSTSR